MCGMCIGKFRRNQEGWALRVQETTMVNKRRERSSGEWCEVEKMFDLQERVHVSQPWVRLACLDSVISVVCCRHSRFTPGIGAWNPTGYYPILEGLPKNVPLQERWQDVDNIIPNHWTPYDPDDTDRPKVRRGVPYRIWGDQEASSSDPETGSEYYEELARLCKVMANKPYTYPDETGVGE
eukprot:875027-Amphidinium_carterae.1